LEEEIRKGTPGAQAWTQALSRLGKPAGTASGFAIGERSRSFASLLRRFWPWITVAAVFLTFWMTLWIAKSSAALSPLLTFHIASVTLGYGAVFFGAFLAAVYLIQRLFRSPTLDIYQKRLRLLTSVAGAAALLTGLGVASGSIWANTHFGRYFLWDARDTGGVIVTLWCVAAWWGTRARRLTGHAPMVAACIAGVLVAWSWFGANAWVDLAQNSGVTQHSFSTVWTGLFVFTCLEAVLALSAALPAGGLGKNRRRGRDVDLIA
jgi:hypothetical protein